MSGARTHRWLVALASVLMFGACDQATATPEPPSSSTAPARDTGEAPAGGRSEAKREPKREPADPFAEGFVVAHNRHRASVSPPADPPLPPVTWSPELAAQAKKWAERCTFEHSETDLGENLSARTDLAEPDAIVAAWAAEAEWFDHAKNRCANGKVCGHYTQVVWRDSTQIGCGMAQCSPGGPFGDSAWVMWVCNYSPAGNWKGQRPY